MEDVGLAGVVGGGGCWFGGGGGSRGCLGVRDSGACEEERCGEEHRNPDFHCPSCIAQVVLRGRWGLRGADGKFSGG